MYIIYHLYRLKYINFQCVFRPDLLAASGKNRTDPETIAADRERPCLCPQVPGATLPVRTAQLFNMGTERKRTAFMALRGASISGASPGLEDDVMM